MPLQTGARLGPYEILAPLGAGGMGRVYKARQLQLDRMVALKFLAAHLIESEEHKQRLLREAKARGGFLHTAGAYDFKTKKVVYQPIDAIRQYHKLHNGWHDIGYHWVIEEDGRLMPGRDETVIGAHVGGFNDHSIGICVTGHGDFAPFKPAQLAALVRLCARKCEEFKLSGIRVIDRKSVV